MDTKKNKDNRNCTPDKLNYNLGKYLRAGRKCILLKPKQKLPLGKSWQNKQYTEEQLSRHVSRGGNIGMFVGEDLLVVDVDFRGTVEQNGLQVPEAELSLEKLRKDTGETLLPTVCSPRGYHIYFRKNTNLKLPQKNKNYPSIDFLTGNRQCLIPGCVVEYEGEPEPRVYCWGEEQESLPELDIPELPEKLKSILTGSPEPLLQATKQISISQEAVQKAAAWCPVEDEEVPADHVEKVLRELDANMEYPDWIRVGMALKNWCRGADEGLRLWKNWSKTGTEKYKKGECLRHWKSFSDTLFPGEDITVSTLIWMAKQKHLNIHKEPRPTLVSPGYRNRMQEENAPPRGAVSESEFKEKLLSVVWGAEFSGEEYFRKTIGPVLRQYELTEIQKEQIVTGVQTRLGENGTKIPVRLVRKMVAEFTEETRTESKEETKDPDITELTKAIQDFVFAGKENTFIDTKTMESFSSRMFDGLFGHLVPGTSGGKPFASHYVLKNSLISLVRKTERIPGAGKYFREESGVPVLNTFLPESIPKPADKHTPAGRAAIERIEKHCENLAAENAEILLRWISHQVQHPGRLIGWMLILVSFPGLGKSYLTQLLTTLLGNKNIGITKSNEIFSKYKGAWGDGMISLVVEELSLTENGKEYAMNEIKDYITNPVVRVERKYENAKTVRNTANMIGFTNRPNMISVDHSDRRYCILSSELQDLNALHAHSSYYPDYFNDLHADLIPHAGEIRKWFLEKDLGNFLEVRTAPMTIAKLSVIHTEQACKEGFTEVLELIEKGAFGYNPDCISFWHLYRDLMMEFTEDFPSRYKVRCYLMQMGYTAQEKRIWLEGVSTYVWTKRFMTPPEIRKCLDETNPSPDPVRK